MAELADAADSKSAEGNLVGVRPPLPAPSNLFICNMLQGREVLEENPSSTNTYTAYLAYFQLFTVFEMWFGNCHLHALRSIYRLPQHTFVYGVRGG
jgi:hypothetical protein